MRSAQQEESEYGVCQTHFQGDLECARSTKTAAEVPAGISGRSGFGSASNTIDSDLEVYDTVNSESDQPVTQEQFRTRLGRLGGVNEVLKPLN
jgi:hypothetical protein